MNDDESTITRDTVRTNEQREFRGTLRQIQELLQELDSREKRNQDFVAPTLCHMPVQVVSVEVRENTSIRSENAFWRCDLDRT